MTAELKVVVLYWTDPWHLAAPGGIDSYIRCFLKYAPPEVAIDVIGVTADRRARAVGRWLDLPLGSRTVRFFALYAPQNLSRGRIPHCLRYCMQLALHRIRSDASIVIAHRPEPLLFGLRTKHAVLVHHIGPSDVPGNGATDFRWARARRVYGWMESFAVRRAQRIHTVTQRAFDYYRQRYPSSADKTRFFPTCFDPEIFTIPGPRERISARRTLRAELGLPDDAEIAISVGRLDHQKDIQLSIAAFALLRRQHERLFLVIAGAGILRTRIAAAIAAAGLEDRIRLLGSRTAPEIAALHHGADLYLLTSAYEGMSIALLEAQACGLPVVASDVGEARRTVTEGSGYLAARTPRDVASSVARCLGGRDSFTPQAAARAAAPYSAAAVIPAICADLRGLE